ncbi:MAG: hypothetical protein R2940_13275 [Syntrophotaleaceae bacterium]
MADGDRNESITRGLQELRTGEEEIVAEKDEFFETIKRETRERQKGPGCCRYGEIGYGPLM